LRRTRNYPSDSTYEKGTNIISLEQIEDKALQLSEGDRAKLAWKPLLSLDVLSESEIAKENVMEASFFKLSTVLDLKKILLNDIKPKIVFWFQLFMQSSIIKRRAFSPR